MISVPSASIHVALDAVFRMDKVEVYKQSNGFTTELKVRKHLGLVNWGNPIHRLQFNDHQVFGQKVNSVAAFELDTFVSGWKRDLTMTFESSLLKFVLQTCQVSALK